MTTVPDSCPTCRSNVPNVCRSDCYNPWHRGLVVHLPKEPDGTPGEAIDPPRVPTCDPAMPLPRHRELSDEEVDRATPDDLRAAYRSLLAHHVDETTALRSRGDDITRRRDELLTKDHQVLEHAQKLIVKASSIMQSDEETIDRLGAENAQLAEILDFMRNHYSPIGGRSCALCVYEERQFVRPCAVHRWDDTAAKLLASRVQATPSYLSDNELAAWMARAGLSRAALEGTYLGLVLAELRERRDAEAMFVDADLQLQRISECLTCADDTHATDDEHRAIVKRWRIAQGALCALARIHRGYLRSLDAPKDEPR